MKYAVIKTISLRFECEADNEQDAEDQCIQADEALMALDDCQYEVEEIEEEE